MPPAAAPPVLLLTVALAATPQAKIDRSVQRPQMEMVRPGCLYLHLLRARSRFPAASDRRRARSRSPRRIRFANAGAESGETPAKVPCQRRDASGGGEGGGDNEEADEDPGRGGKAYTDAQIVEKLMELGDGVQFRYGHRSKLADVMEQFNWSREKLLNLVLASEEDDEEDGHRVILGQCFVFSRDSVSRAQRGLLVLSNTTTFPLPLSRA